MEPRTRPGWLTLGNVLAAGVAIVVLILLLTHQMDALPAGLYLALALAYIVG